VIALVQRVTEARVVVDESVVGEIDAGILALVGVERGDGAVQAVRLAEKVAAYRIFADAEGKMNLSLAQTGGGLLAVPQFTLAADTHKGLRPGFSGAADPADGERLFDCFVDAAKTGLTHVATGRFGAHMLVHLVNDGPVTFWLKT
jgi:D-tyrosyl-tRNA(Tyr) deacylase